MKNMKNTKNELDHYRIISPAFHSFLRLYFQIKLEKLFDTFKIIVKTLIKDM